MYGVLDKLLTVKHLQYGNIALVTPFLDFGCAYFQYMPPINIIILKQILLQIFIS